jgi:hypothetical protein
LFVVLSLNGVLVKIGLQKSCRQLVSVQGKCVVWLFAVIPMNPGTHSEIHQVLADRFELVQCRIFQVEERADANFFTLKV